MSQPPDGHDRPSADPTVGEPPPPPPPLIDPTASGVDAEPVTAPVGRPAAVVAGCVMAWIGSAIGMLAGVFALAISESSDLLDQIATDADRDDAARLMHVSGAITLVWCLVVAVFAYFAFRRANWGALAVVVMASVVISLSVVNLSVTGSAEATPALVWSAASALLVYGAKSCRDWFKTGA